MGALNIQQLPLVVQAPNGALIPIDGNSVVNGGDQAPIAGAALDDSGQNDPHSAISSAGDKGALVAANAPQATLMKSSGKSFAGPANGALLSQPRQPAPLQDLPSTPSMISPTHAEGANLKSMLGRLFGNAGDLGGTDAYDSPDMESGMDYSIPDASTSPSSASPAPASEPGFFDKLKGLIGLDSSSAAGPSPAAATAPAGSPASAPASQSDSGGILSRVWGAIKDKGDPLMDDPASAATMNQRYGDSYKSPDWFQRLRADPTRLGLLTGGLATMASAARPGQTVGGAIGEGALQGIGGVYQQQMDERAANLAASKEASEAELRQNQGDFYRTRGGALQENADTNATYRPQMAEAALNRAGALQTGADARVTDAAARGKQAEAAMVRANAYAQSTSNPTGVLRNLKYMVDNKEAPDIETAANMLKGGTTSAQRAGLITNRERTILGANLSPTPEDIIRANQQATHEIDDTLSMAAPTPLPGKGALPNGEPLPALQALPGTGAAKAQSGGSGAMSAPAPANAAPGNQPAPQKQGVMPGPKPGAQFSITSPAKPASAADRDKLPKGAYYISPIDQKLYQKAN